MTPKIHIFRWVTLVLVQIFQCFDFFYKNNKIKDENNFNCWFDQGITWSHDMLIFFSVCIFILSYRKVTHFDKNPRLIKMKKISLFCQCRWWTSDRWVGELWEKHLLPVRNLEVVQHTKTRQANLICTEKFNNNILSFNENKNRSIKNSEPT